MQFEESKVSWFNLDFLISRAGRPFVSLLGDSPLVQLGRHALPRRNLRTANRLVLEVKPMPSRIPTDDGKTYRRHKMARYRLATPAIKVGG